MTQPPHGFMKQNDVNARTSHKGIIEGTSIPCKCRLLFSLVFAIFMALVNSDDKGKSRDGMCKACWMKQNLKDCESYTPVKS